MHVVFLLLETDSLIHRQGIVKDIFDKSKPQRRQKIEWHQSINQKNKTWLKKIIPFSETVKWKREGEAKSDFRNEKKVEDEYLHIG